MSAVAAVLHRDRRPVERQEICAVLERIRDRGPDHHAVIVSGVAGLGHALLQTVPEDRAGVQPALDQARDLALALDGRVDNRDEIAAIGGGPSADRSDAALLLAAYAEMGPRVFGRILGDFAVVVWDGPEQRLIAARDVFGIRPLVYREAGARVLVASEVRALVPEGPVQINQGRVAEMLAGFPTSADESLYRDISRLKPGHLLIASHDGVRVEAFTEIDGTRRVEPRSRAGWHEEFRSLMDAAVLARLRASTGVGLMLSGGLDSTSVYSTVQALAPDRDVPAFTTALRAPDQESPVARETAAYLGGRSVSVPAGMSSFDPIEAASRLLELPVSPGGSNASTLHARAVEDRRRVLLSGDGGDEWYTGSNWAGADLLRRFRFGALARLWRGRLATVDAPPVMDLLQSTLVPLVPDAIKRLARPLRRRSSTPPWLRPGFVAATSLPDRLRVRPAVKADSTARWAILVDALHGLNLYAFEDNDRLASMLGTEVRMPFYDRRLVEFALALPDEVLAAQPVRKQFVRDALAGRLPPRFRTTQPCSDYEYINRQGLERLGGRALFDRLAVADAGFVDGRLARDACDACLAGRAFGGLAARDLSWPLWSVAAVEVWWRTMTGVPGRVAGH